ncbi:MAG: hypothetical protein MK078_00735 [Crocinitomicaceae bacterium]|nr:hypothetical protein [Crocinitomicaceae bacterium]
MATSIITPDDLEQFKWELLADIKQLLDKKQDKVAPVKKLSLLVLMVFLMLKISPYFLHFFCSNSMGFER